MSCDNKARAILVHGGAWSIPDSIYCASERGAQRAAEAGWRVLSSGGSALDAVEAAVRVLEDDPVFDAGTGSVLNEDGKVEMDAIITSGSGGVGAVAGVTRFANPVSIARAVMEKTPHCMLIGEGAERLALREGFEPLPSADSLVTEAARAEFQQFIQYRHTVGALFNGASDDSTASQNSHDTVGAVALDCNGKLAAATSTGGITAKMAGRVGDSPLYGCGAFADDDLCAVSTTGHGESIIKAMLARNVGIQRQLHPGWSAEDCAQVALDEMKAKTGGCGGLICVFPDGQFGAKFTTSAMISCAIVDGQVSFPTHKPNEGENRDSDKNT